MAFNQNKGLYFSVKVNDTLDVIGGNLHELATNSNLFTVFPTVQLAIGNKDNFYPDTGVLAAGSKYKIVIGESDQDQETQLDVIDNYLLSKWAIDRADQELQGRLLLDLVHPKFTKYFIQSPAQAFNNQSTSDIITSIISNDFPSDQRDIEATSTRGTFIKPSNQSLLDFLEILTNRSISSAASPSKMCMWVDFDGIFHFRSLNYLISQSAIEVDLMNPALYAKSPGKFEYLYEGIRFNNPEKNTTYKSYKLNREGNGELITFSRPNLSPLGGGNFTATATTLLNQDQNQNVLWGVEHNQLPQDYVKAQYINSFYPFPVSLSFSMLYDYRLEVGKQIKVLFPHADKDREVENSIFSNKFLIVGLEKKMFGRQYVMKVHASTNSFKSDVTNKIKVQSGVP